MEPNEPVLLPAFSEKDALNRDVSEELFALYRDRILQDAASDEEVIDRIKQAYTVAEIPDPSSYIPVHAVSIHDATAFLIKGTGGQSPPAPFFSPAPCGASIALRRLRHTWCLSTPLRQNKCDSGDNPRCHILLSE